MRQMTEKLVGFLALLLLVVVTSPGAQAADTAVDMETFDLEFTATDVAYEAINTQAGYQITMSLESQNGYLFGMYRQTLDWSEQDGITLTLHNESNDTTLLSLHLIDEDWNSITLPDGAIVLLQAEGEDDYIVVFTSDSTVVIPAGFQGNMMIPLDVTEGDFSSLQGFGLTFIPLDEAVVTLARFAFWSEEITQLRDSLGTATLQLQDHSICVPETGESMTVACVSGLTGNQEIVYSLVNPPLGATINQQGHIVVDDTVTASELIVKAEIDQQLYLETTLFLYTVWDVIPDDVALEDFTVLDPSNYATAGYYPLLTQATDYVGHIQMLGVGVGAIIFLTYTLWRRGTRKP